MNGYEVFEGFAYWYLNANHFDPERRKQSLGLKPEPDRLLRAQFKRVLDKRPYTFETWEDLTAVSLDTDEELYDHLRRVYQYLFHEGPYPTFE